MEFCKEHMNEDKNNWIYTDESNFRLSRNTIGVWTKEQKVYKDNSNKKSSLMVWGAISKRGKSPLHIFKPGETENQQKYQQILEKEFLGWNDKIFPNGNSVFYQDNAKPHVGKKVSSWMEENIPQKINSPPYSPDLNPIENVWSILKNNVEKSEPKNLRELKKSINTSWEELDQQTINKCIDHSFSQMNQVFKHSGSYLE